MIPEQDFERLSAYLDNQLSPAETSRLEGQLAQDAELKAALADLRRQARALRDLPRLKPPRNFTLTPQQAQALRQPRPAFFNALFPALRLATSLSAAAFALILSAAVLTPPLPTALAPRQAAAPQVVAPTLKEAGGAGQAEAPAAALVPEATPAADMMLSAAPAATMEAAGSVTETYGLAAEPPANDAGRSEQTLAETPTADQLGLSGTAAPAPPRIALSEWAFILGVLTALLAAAWAGLAWLAQRR